MEHCRMTEEDTFNALRRPNIHEMVSLYHRWIFSNYPGHKNTLHNIEFPKAHGWEWIEFLEAKKAAGYTS
jgi:hypothetical protein